MKRSEKSGRHWKVRAAVYTPAHAHLTCTCTAQATSSRRQLDKWQPLTPVCAAHCYTAGRGQAHPHRAAA